MLSAGLPTDHISAHLRALQIWMSQASSARLWPLFWIVLSVDPVPGAAACLGRALPGERRAGENGICGEGRKHRAPRDKTKHRPGAHVEPPKP